MPRYGAFTAQTSCPKCGQPVPVNAPLQAVRCGACRAEVPIHDGLWNWLLGKLDDDHDDMVEEVPSPFSQRIEGVTYRCTYARKVPRCDKCSAELPLEVPLQVERDLFCTNCGDGASVYPAPAWLTLYMHNAQQVFSVDRGAGAVERRGVAEEPDATPPKPVVMPCPQCGGSLSLGRQVERVISCHYCSADVFLPDAVWSRLHPVRQVREWFVRFDGETEAARRARKSRGTA